MPIVFAAIAPHPPVLIPEIGKENIKQLAVTQTALQKLEEEFYAAKPESVVIISPHGKILDDSFNINFSPEYVADFKEFGDYSLELKFKSDYLSIQQIRAADEGGQKIPLMLSSDIHLDHGCSIPLYFLARHLKNLPIIPITYSLLDNQQHYAFGEFLHRQLAKINKRFAIIASGDLSHRLTKTAPGGYNAKGKDYDKKIIELIRSNNASALVDLDPKLIAAAGECGLRSFITLFGLIKSLRVQPDILSYESPFGVGYLVCNFKIS